MYNIKKSKILERIALGENQHQDFKFEISDAKKIARSFAAFANTDGGSLLLGVKDNGSITGVRTGEEIYMAEAAAKMYCTPEVPFSLKEWKIEGKTIIEIIIPKSDKKPIKALSHNGKWLAYIRVNDQNILVNKVMIDVWKAKANNIETKINYGETEAKLLKYLDEHKKITLSKVCKICDISRYKAQKLLTDFILLRLVNIVFTEKECYYVNLEI
ncbi:ATP-binding protein [Odoribacter sp. OttesenSCG-928-L07]|nr:ATP-binding protein [Odoribacter sp. OttesenSCG-928-L07]MDL2239574.1 ATP-binding protein [Bacteroidales bacterium OttesenSCG-928-L14]MDL2241051.1 ATP-binding protein [Bacteroidales bacterium OttesenSCG-928-K22]